MPNDNLTQAIEILQLVNTLAPAGVALVKTLATKLQGKTDEELKATGDAIDDAIIAAADMELAKLDGTAAPAGPVAPVTPTE